MEIGKAFTGILRVLALPRKVSPENRVLSPFWELGVSIVALLFNPENKKLKLTDVRFCVLYKHLGRNFQSVSIQTKFTPNEQLFLLCLC